MTFIFADRYSPLSLHACLHKNVINILANMMPEQTINTGFSQIQDLHIVWIKFCYLNKHIMLLNYPYINGIKVS